VYEHDHLTIPIEEEVIGDEKKIKQALEKLRKDMLKAASDLEFEKAAELRDKIQVLEEKYMSL
jgi:excinuclease ABC subunit B